MGLATLLLRLAGPMQSWGTQSRFTVRDAGSEPSKSGVIGLLCAALGRDRAEAVDDLAALRMGVRVDQEGQLAMDYHTVGGKHRRGDCYGVYKEEKGKLVTVTSHRYYLADADFLVGLEGEEGLLRLVEEHLQTPVWPLFLGRKSFVPGVPVFVPGGLLPGTKLEEALTTGYPWPRLGLNIPAGRRPAVLRFVRETDAGPGAEPRWDQPLGAAFQHRRFALRYVRTEPLTLGKQVPIREV